MPNFQINGIDMHIDSQGRGESLILLHSGLADSRMWKGQMAALAAHFHVLRYDLPGFGQSATHPAPFSYLDDLLLIMRHFEIESAHLVGLSLGGMIALDFALEHPHRVKKLVLPAASIRGYDYVHAAEWVADYLAALSRGRAASVKFWLDHPNFRSAKAAHPEVFAALRDMLLENFLAWNPFSNKPEVIWPPQASIERLEDISAPTLVMIGEHDTKDLIACADTLARRIPHAQKIEYPRVGHHFPMEIPERFNSDLIAFLQEDAG